MRPTSFIVTVLAIISSGGAEHVESVAGFAINSTSAASPLPKKATQQKNNQQVDVVVSGTGTSSGKSAVFDAMELIDPKASEQVLELIVKIAQHPATWKQIHRVLETLEANNAAYSQRIDATRSELGWINKRLDRPGDKRNDVPDEKVTILSNATSTVAPTPSLETTFQRWRNVLFASAVPKEPTAIHPQLSKVTSEMQSVGELRIQHIIPNQPEVSSSSSLPINQPEQQQLQIEKKFEERLSEIEDELKKLTKMSRMMPLRLKQLTAIAGHQQEKRTKSANKTLKKNFAHQNLNDSSTFATKSQHPKFQYHRVHNTSIQPTTSNLLGPNFWKKIASLKHNGSNPTSRRNSFVAVSISPAPPSDISKIEESQISHIGHQTMLATEPVKPGFSKLCKKNHNLRKQKHQQSRRAVGRHNDDVFNV